MSGLRPRRSVLYVPAANARALEKARSLPADALIVDLEDAIAPAAKDSARSAAAAAIRAGGFGHRELCLRINGLDSPWGEADLQVAAELPLAALVLPKLEQPEDVRRAAAALDRAGSSARLWCMIESPRAVLKLEELAGSSPRIEALVLGTSDLQKELRALPTPDRAPLAFALSKTVLVARALSLVALDGVHLDLDDAAGFEATCLQGRALGFDGRTLIHPKTIDAANRIYGPSAAEIESARRVVAAYREAVEAGQGVAVLEGKLIEALHRTMAERVLAMAEAIEAQAAT